MNRCLSPILMLSLLSACGDERASAGHELSDAGSGDSGPTSEVDAPLARFAKTEEPDDLCRPLSDQTQLFLTKFHDDTQASCAMHGGSDASFVWTAPKTGLFLFEARNTWVVPDPAREYTPDTPLSDFPRDCCESAPALYALDGSCEGPELACAKANVIGEDDSLSRFVLWLAAGQPVTLVLDHKRTTVPAGSDETERPGGQVLSGLSVEALSCAVTPLELATKTEVMLRPIGPPVRDTSCQTKAASAQTSYAFQAAVTGRYRFSVDSAYDEGASLALVDETCREELACAVTPNADPAELEREMQAGETIGVIVTSETSSEYDYRAELIVNGPV